MKVARAVSQYIARMQSLGFRYDSMKEFYDSFSARFGQKHLSALTQEDISAFLSRRRTSYSTWRQNYNRLKPFFKYLQLVGKMESMPLPPPRPPQPNRFPPCVYSREEIKKLTNKRTIITVLSHPNHRNVLEPETFRNFILFLYGTGVSVNEALNLLWSNVDLRRDLMSVRRHEDGPLRTIPIGRDIHNLLMRHRKLQKLQSADRGYCFRSKHSTKISIPTLQSDFRTVRDLAKIFRRGGSYHQVRMHDLRRTFAIHRIEYWYREGADVEALLPALSAYLGYGGLRPVYKYLLLSPDFYRKQLSADTG